MTRDNSFLGTGWSFPPSFDTRTRAAALVSAEEDIAQSLRILFSTTPGERVMQPTYGCDLKFMVFETIDESVLTDLKDAIERAVRFFEVRITLNAIDIDEGEWIEGILKLNLDYTIRGTNTRNNLVFPLYLEQGSGVGHRA
ncbi:GPW/gp25 family protein [Phenylobacterium sp.]|uniref:GPW/gp25 family protein n=1 Tax=Phenylobacterium sp. TaxID=1871053 RepID=UPI0025D6A2D6|nr:GPW/gp25 family protein [Phenylobacterium sp.]